MILALDLGTSCGFAVAKRDGSIVASGTWELGEDPPRRVQRLLLHIVDGPRVTLIAYEKVVFHYGVDAAHVYGALEGIVHLACADREIPYLPVNAAKVKAAAGLSGKAKKEDMVAAARATWGDAAVATHDEADARFVAMAALQELRNKE